MLLELRNINKSFGNKKILDSINLKIDSGELISLVGPSGVGKTTLLKILAGIESFDKGDLIFFQDMKGHNNPILVFQDYLLFPNLTVFENIAFGMKSRKFDKSKIHEKTMAISSYLKIEDKLGNYPGQLSSGQKQRVAIARALVLNPKLLLLDEPFANLDKNLKLETAELIKATQKQFNLTIISVTHDLKEAFLISDKIGVILDGKLQQFDTPKNIYINPTNLSIALLLGEINILSDNLSSKLLNITNNEEKNQNICIRPESIELIKNSNGAGKIININFSGHYSNANISYFGENLNVLLKNNSFSTGDRVDLSITEYLSFRR